MATVLSGKAISSEVRSSLVTDVASMSSLGVVPGLAIVQVGDREDSNVYIRMKIKAAKECGIEATHIKLPGYQ